jgi:hypothetical protein
MWLAAVMLAAGCGGPKPPDTYPAGGKVVYADGAALTGGTVEFQAQAAGAPSAVGEVGKDGAFALYTLFNGSKVAGAAAGRYRVLVIPPFGADQAVQPVNLPDVYTVQPGTGNDFTLSVPRPR